ncbi:MAG: hypothetical protein HDR13_13755 [Lachnospiraceae bacterium]|nr:hypothetical protein [Lachnospiraceae bacterium]
MEYSSLTRADILSYFLPDHKEDMLCVYDDFNTRGYVGIITYDSFKHSLSVDGAIKQEYVILNADIWRNAREYFRYRKEALTVDRLLPVLDEEYRLICFAYEDVDANREIRMLKELSEQPEALQFADIYPEYQWVKIYEFNELAYFFAKYLESQNIPVQVQGVMWQNFFAGEECRVADYACLVIYAEGITAKKENLLENALRSVSAEFECIDRIYEANIKKGVFHNAEESWEELAERLRGEKEIVIIGTDIVAQRTYGFLTKNEIDVCCFMGDQNGNKMFGKKILDCQGIRNTYKSPVYIECTSKGSAWGVGDVDNYDYVGCERNKRFILMRDYVEVPDDSVIDAIRNRKVVLLGDLYLCQRLSEYLIQNGVAVSGCLGMLPQDDVFEEVSGRQIDYSDSDITWLLVYPEAWDLDLTWLKEEERVISYCREKGIDDYTDCFSIIETYVNVEKRCVSLPEHLRVKRIVIGAIDDHSGNIFFRGLLDNHPMVLMIADYVHFNNNLFWICTSLSMVSARNILSVFWGTYGDIATEAIYNKELFNEKMEQLLKYEDRVTSQQLFVMFHIAYMYMDGKNTAESDINDMVIYWEPHDLSREKVEDFAKWLGGAENISCSIAKVVRNRCMQIGSRIKMRLFKNKGMVMNRGDVLAPYSLDKKEYDKVDWLTVRFEDLKCEPARTLLDICNRMDISWSESLMVTTCHGKKDAWFNAEKMVSDFDLGPVYDTYEKYFTELDRLRIMIFNGPWQKKYGYPYMELAQFSRRELQELFLLSYRIEDLTGSYKIDETSVRMQKRIWDWLQVLRMYEMMI